MKTLYLIRHAKSRKDIAGIKDKDRPFSSRGEKEAKYIGKHLRKHKIAMKAFYSSPAKRALDTAKIIAKKTGFPLKKIQIKEEIYYSNIPKLMKVIKKINDKFETAAIFGHNPEFFNLVNYLTPKPILEFPTCGVFGIDFDTKSWSKVARKKGRVSFLELPNI